MLKQRKQKNGRTTNKEQFQQTFGKPIQEYESIKRAVTALSEETKENYYWQLSAFFLFLGEDPDTVFSNRKSDLFSGIPENEERYERQVKLYAKHLLAKGYTGRSTQGVIGRIQGFFANNSKRLALDLKNEIKLPKARRHRKYSPENSEVRELLDHADCARDKFIIAIMYQNGFVPVDIAALNVGDYPSEPWQYFERSRSKTGEVIRGVSMPDVCSALNAYMKIRGEEAGPLLLGREGPLNNKAVTQVVSCIIQNVPKLHEVKGFKPTNLRDAFEDSLKAAGIYPKTKEAMMGHASSIEMEYGGYKQMMDSFVDAAKKVYAFLRLTDVAQTEYDEKVKEELEELSAKVAEKDQVIESLVRTGVELKEKMQKIESSKEGIEVLLKRVIELEKKLEEKK
ncbi:MAG: tyrosine-type recombinase/integrase [Candidatus Bathyarchaeia archaeon]|jgi:integrase